MQEWQIRKRNGETLRVRSPYEAVTKEDGSIDIVKSAVGKHPAKVVDTVKHGDWVSVTAPYDPTPKVTTYSEGGE